MSELAPHHEPAAELARSQGTARSLAEAWLASQTSPRTVRNYRRAIDRWLSWCEVAQVDPLNAYGISVEAWSRDIAAEHGLGSTSVAGHHAALASYYAYVLRADGRGELAARNPLAAVKRIKVPRAGRTPSLTRDQVRAVLTEARKRPRDEVLLLLLATTGARVAEVAAASVGDVDEDGGEVVLRVVRKGGMPQSLVLSPAVAERVRAWVAKRRADPGLRLPAGLEDPLVPSLARAHRGGWLSAKSASAVVSRLMRRALCLPRGGHSLRVTAATQLSDVLPLSAIQELLGHASSATTDGYVRRGRRLGDGRTAAGVLEQRYASGSGSATL